jgi:hypothetical protein
VEEGKDSQTILDYGGLYVFSLHQNMQRFERRSGLWWECAIQWLWFGVSKMEMYA